MITSTEISIGTYKVNTNFTKEMVDDLSNYRSIDSIERELERILKAQNRNDKIDKILEL